MGDMAVAPSPATGPLPSPEPQLPLSVSVVESGFGGDCRTGSVLLSAAGTYMGFFGRRIWGTLKGCTERFDVDWGDVGDTFAGVLAPEPIEM
jgi:hypothetical protein